jgi:hypothetical protein
MQIPTIKGGYTEFANVKGKRVYVKFSCSHLADVFGQLIFFDDAREKGFWISIIYGRGF